MDDHQDPGTLIVPHHEPVGPKPIKDGAPAPERSDEDPVPVPNPVPEAEPTTPLPTNVSPEVKGAQADFVQPDTADGWFHQEDSSSSQPGLPLEGIQWTSSEFIAHDKSMQWYGMLGIGAILAAGLMFLITRDLISTSVVVFAAIIFGVMAGRKPRTQQYGLSGRGLQIGQKFYGLQDFKTFSVTEDGAIASIVLNPLKRFMPPLTIYVVPELEERVINFLSAYLPFEPHKADAVDSLLKRIRF